MGIMDPLCLYAYVKDTAIKVNTQSLICSDEGLMHNAPKFPASLRRRQFTNYPQKYWVNAFQITDFRKVSNLEFFEIFGRAGAFFRIFS